MEDVTREQRQAARNRAWRKNGHSGGKNKASQHQKSDLDEPVPCKMPSKRYDKGEKMVLVRLKPVGSHEREKLVLVRPKPVASPRTEDH